MTSLVSLSLSGAPFAYILLQCLETYFALRQGARLDKRHNVIKKHCLKVSKQHGRPVKQKEVQFVCSDLKIS